MRIPISILFEIDYTLFIDYSQFYFEKNRNRITKKIVKTIFLLENFPSFSAVCSLVSYMGYYCLSSWDIFTSVGIVVTALAVDCDVGTFNLAT